MTMEIAKLILQIVVLVMAGVVIPAFKRWLEMKVDNEAMEQVRSWVYTAVYAAEQLHNHAKKDDPTGEIRFKYAYDFVWTICGYAGIEISGDELKALIEAAVISLETAEKLTGDGGNKDGSKE